MAAPPPPPVPQETRLPVIVNVIRDIYFRLTALANSTAAGIWAGTSTAMGLTPASLLASEAFVTVTPAVAVFTPSQNAGRNFLLTLADNSTLAMMSNLKGGRGGTIWVVQDASGTNTLDVSAYMTATTITIATGANEISVLRYQTNPAGTDVALWMAGADFA